jgi:hypothetical protein
MPDHFPNHTNSPTFVSVVMKLPDTLPYRPRSDRDDDAGLLPFAVLAGLDQE